MIEKSKEKWTEVEGPKKESKFRLWMVVLPACLCVFGIMFLYGHNHIMDETSAAEVEGFTQEEGNQMVALIQEDFDEAISYLTSETSEESLPTGENFYVIFYVVTTESDEYIYKYIFRKYIEAYEDYEEGQVVLYSHNITNDYTKEEIITEEVTE